MSKLRFVINGTDIDMGNIIMPLTLSNPMFESVGSHSLPVKIIRTNNNDLALGSPHPGSENHTKRFPSQIYMGIVPFYGEFVIDSVKSKYIEGYYTTGNATFRELVKDQKLTDIDYTEVIAGSSSVSFTVALEAAARSSYPTHNYTCFPILAQKYWGDQIFAYSVFINPWVYSNTPANEGFRALTQPSSAMIYAASFYLCFVISKIFEESGYTIELNDFYDDAELRTMVITNFNTLGFTSTYNQYDLKFSESLPPIGINEFITSLEEKFNITFHISDLDRTVNIKKNTTVVKSQAVKDFTLINREYQPEEYDGFVLNYNMDPDDPFSAVSPIDDYTLGITVDNKEDLASYPAASYQSQLAKITNNDQYYISRLSDVGSYAWEWQPLTKDYFKYAIDGEKLEIITDANPILTDNAELYIDTPLHGSPEHALYPRVDKSGLNSDGDRDFKTFSTLRLLFYRGIIDSGGLITNPATQVGQYPLASPDVYRPRGLTSPARYGRVKITAANQSLRWGGTYGLYNTHWKDYLYWWQNIKRPARDYYQMSLADLLSINFWEKYRSDGISFIFRSINIELDFAKDSIRIGECEVYLS